MKWILVFLILSVTSGAVAQEQSQAEAELPDPQIAFVKSMVAPGWGHYYVDQIDWTRGKYHLAAEAGFILSYVGFSIHSNNLRQNWFAYVRHEAGVRLEDRSRRFRLAVGDFNSLEAYNDYQLRSRNWDRLYADTPENRWNWSSDQTRAEYNSLRNRFERIDQQLPALLAMMAVNRIVSGISAYNRAKKRKESGSVTSSLYLSPYHYIDGVVANLKVNF